VGILLSEALAIFVATAFPFVFGSRLPWLVVLKVLEQNIRPTSDTDRPHPAHSHQVADRLMRDLSERGRLAYGDQIVGVDLHSSKLLRDRKVPALSLKAALSVRLALPSLQ